MRDVKAIRLGARTYRIIWDGELAAEISASITPEPGEEASDKCYGVLAHVDRLIVLSPEFHKSGAGMLETLLHECIHVCEPFLGQSVDHDTLDGLANLLASLLLQSHIIEPSELAIAGVPLVSKRTQKLKSVDGSPHDEEA